MSLRRRLPAVLAALCALAALAPAQADAPAQAESAVMAIDGRPVGADAFGRWMLDLHSSRLAREFAEQWLVRRAARERGVELAPGALERELEGEVADRVQHAFLGVRADWLAELARLGQSEGGYRAARRTALEPRLLATEMCRRGRVVPEDKVVRDWELDFGPRGHEFALSGILFAVAVETPDDGADQELEARRRQAFAAGLARALDARERALAGEDFAALARALSDDPATRANGGRIDARFRPPGWNAPFVEQVLQLREGALAPPMYAKGGFWLLRVEGLAVTPLESVRAQLVQRLLERGPEQDEIGRVWSALTEGLQVELLPALFAEPALAPESREPRIGLRVNGEAVARAEFATWLLRSRGEHCASEFAEHFLVEREAARLGLGAGDAEVDARLDELRRTLIADAQQGSRELWLQSLRQRGRDEAGWTREWRRRARIDVLTGKLARAERLAAIDLAAVRNQLLQRARLEVLPAMYR